MLKVKQAAALVWVLLVGEQQKDLGIILHEELLGFASVTHGCLLLCS